MKKQRIFFLLVGAVLLIAAAVPSPLYVGRFVGNAFGLTNFTGVVTTNGQNVFTGSNYFGASMGGNADGLTNIHTLWFSPIARLGVRKTPILGWNSWARYNNGCNENILTNTALSMATNGLLDAGYEYLVLDEGWAESNRVSGHLVPNATKFPSTAGSGSFKVLTDWLHARGFKLGLYTEVTSITNGRTVSNVQPETGPNDFVTDANDFAAWGIDYVKADGDGTVPTYLNIFSRALLDTRRPIYLMAGAGGHNYNTPTNGGYAGLLRTPDWFPGLVNSFRNGGDSGSGGAGNQAEIDDAWTNTIRWNASLQEVGFNGVLIHIDHGIYSNSVLTYPGTHLDLDQMHPFTSSWTNSVKVQMSMYSMCHADLMTEMGAVGLTTGTLADVGDFWGIYRDQYTNPYCILIDQDPAQIPPYEVTNNAGAAVYVTCLGSQLFNTPRAVAFLDRNVSGTGHAVTVTANQLGMRAGWLRFFDCWTREERWYSNSITWTSPSNKLCDIYLVSSLADVDWDVDALNYMGRLGTTITGPQSNAVNFLTLGLKGASAWSAPNPYLGYGGDNIWTNGDLAYPFLGGTAQAHAQNLKSGSFTITNITGASSYWYGTVTHNSSGITGNGTTGYGDTVYVPDTVQGSYQTNAAFLFAWNTNPNATGEAIGSFELTSTALYTGYGYSDPTHVTIDGLNAVQIDTTYGWGSIVNGGGYMRRSPSMLNLFGNAALNVKKDTVDGQWPGVRLPARSFTILARNNQFGIDRFCNATLQFIWVGGKQTDAQYAKFFSLIAAYEAAVR